MEDRSRLFILKVLIITLLPMQVHSQTTFTLKEYAIKDSSFYHELSSLLFSDTVFGSKSKYTFIMRYNTTTVHTDYLTDQQFSANFNIANLMDGQSILGATGIGSKVTGFFYIREMTCFISKSTQTDFVDKYLAPTNNERQFKIYDSFPSVGGFTDVYMNILSSGKIEIVRIIRTE